MREEIPRIPLYKWEDWGDSSAEPLASWAQMFNIVNGIKDGTQDERSLFLANVTGMEPLSAGVPAVASLLGRIELHLIP